jgi:hypothetical protein
MADASYQIISREDESFAVEIVRAGALPQLAAGFATRAAAEGWIAQDRRLHASAPPFATQATRRWRDA